jgi:retinol dehydrogenase 12
MSKLSRFCKQSFFLPIPPLTEDNLPDQTGRVVLITGGYTGVGFELARILYQHNATLYLAGRSSDKATRAIHKLHASFPLSKGRAEFLHVDLSDLRTIKKTTETFLRNEQRLDVLVNNAGVMHTPVAATTSQGHELQIGTNCLGPHLLTKSLYPILKQTASSCPVGSVRVIWAGSLGIDVASPVHGGIDMEDDGTPMPSKKATMLNYAMSKTGNLFLASQWAVQDTPAQSTDAQPRVQHVAFNPGNLRTELQREVQGWHMWLIDKLLLYPAKLGGYTELYAGWSDATASMEANGGYVLPWGRIGNVRIDVQAEVEEGRKSLGAKGKAARFWNWCEREVDAFL